MVAKKSKVKVRRGVKKKAGKRVPGRRVKKEEKNVSMAMAMVALKTEKAISGKAVAAAWKALWDETLSDVTDEDGCIGFDAREGKVIIGMMSGPLPEEDMERVASWSWMWPGAAQGVKGHKSHAIVTVMGPAGDMVACHVLLTRAVAALAKWAAAVYWGEASMLIEPRQFVETAQEHLNAGEFPLTLWVSLQQMPAKKGCASVTTYGMDSLGHRELEVVDAKMALPDLMDFVGGVAGYLLQNGPVLKHGETIGFSEDQKVKVEHCASKFDAKIEVIRLGL